LNPTLGPLLATFSAMLQRMAEVLVLCALISTPFGLASFVLLGSGEDGSVLFGISRALFTSFEAQLRGDAIDPLQDACVHEGAIAACALHLAQLIGGPLLALNLVTAIFTTAYEETSVQASAHQRAASASFALEALRRYVPPKARPVVFEKDEGFQCLTSETGFLETLLRNFQGEHKQILWSGSKVLLGTGMPAPEIRGQLPAENTVNATLDEIKTCLREQGEAIKAILLSKNMTDRGSSV